MKIIIDIPNSLYANLQKIQNGSIASKRLLDCVRNGTPLPKGHGRLIDEKDVIENICEARGCYGHNNCKSKSDNFCGAWDVVEKAPTVLEADISGKE